VEAERIGFQGYGMLLAEIGIPPGADVSRESLEKAFDGDWSLSRYDILPDRIVVYMWSKAGGSKFNFSFKPRYGINAQTPASIVYDYYNEESRGVVSPLRFVVQ
jgi:CD109 antigen